MHARAFLSQELHYAGKLLTKAPPRCCFLVWQQYYNFYKNLLTFLVMINTTIVIVDTCFHFTRFSKPQAHCCYYANIEYNIDRVTAKINSAAKEDLKILANNKSLWTILALFTSGRRKYKRRLIQHLLKT